MAPKLIFQNKTKKKRGTRGQTFFFFNKNKNSAAEKGDRIKLFFLTVTDNVEESGRRGGNLLFIK